MSLLKNVCVCCVRLSIINSLTSYPYLVGFPSLPLACRAVGHPTFGRNGRDRSDNLTCHLHISSLHCDTPIRMSSSWEQDDNRLHIRFAKITLSPIPQRKSEFFRFLSSIPSSHTESKSTTIRRNAVRFRPYPSIYDRKSPFMSVYSHRPIALNSREDDTMTLIYINFRARGN